MFVACSKACLERHAGEVHGGLPGAVAQIAAVNRVDAWDAFAGHRARLTRIVTAAQRGEGLCVLGAGQGLDLDLPALVRAFDEVHLVDIDGDALTRARDRAPERVRARLVLHAGIDLSGCLDRIDEWGDRFPNLALRTAAAREIPARIADAIGRRFDVAMSACVLSQLGLPLQETLVLAPSDWDLLLATVAEIHLATMAALLRPGGTGVLATEVVSSAKAPALFAGIDTDAPEEAGRAIATRAEAAGIVPRPDPAALLATLAGPLGGVVERARRLDSRWLWRTGAVDALVEAILFARRDD